MRIFDVENTDKGEQSSNDVICSLCIAICSCCVFSSTWTVLLFHVVCCALICE